MEVEDEIMVTMAARSRLESREGRYGLVAYADVQRPLSLFVLLFFFFSSRRRHTIFDCDWSSDVCSSDLDWNRAARTTRFGTRDSGGARRALGSPAAHRSDRRSEERRVGKECRSRWSPYH